MGLGLLAGCNAQTGKMAVDNDPNWSPEYLAVSTRLLKDELVSFTVSMRGPRTKDDVYAYADCAAAQYTLIRGVNFFRRVTIKATEADGTWAGDGVYTLSGVIPGGRFTIDAEVAVENCAANNIPMV